VKLLIAILALALAAGLIVRTVRHRQAKRAAAAQQQNDETLAELKQLMERTASGNKAAYDSLNSGCYRKHRFVPWRDVAKSHNLYGPYDDAFTRYGKIKHQQQQVQLLRSLTASLVAARQEDNPTAQADALMHILLILSNESTSGYYEQLAKVSGYTEEQARLELQALLRKAYQERVATVRNPRLTDGQPKALGQLRSLIQWMESNKGLLAKFADFSPLNYPSEWNDHVARIQKNPQWGDFIGVPSLRDLTRGDIQERGSNALVRQDFTEVRIAVALHNAAVNSGLSNELGGCLLAQLLLFAAKHRNAVVPAK
jgi:hypothetical protein